MDEKKQTQTITTSQLARTTLPGKIDYKADEEIKMPSFAPKSASETLKPTPAPAAPKAAEQTSDIEQEIKELDSIAKIRLHPPNFAYTRARSFRRENNCCTSSP